jgi:hypothetical protein
MARLPTPGSDDHNWGDILNDYLMVEHANDGSLKKANDIATALSVANAAQTAANARIEKSLATTKGDLLAASGAGIFGRLGAGSDGQILAADAAQTLGIRWKNNSDAFLHTADYGVTADGTTNDAAAFQAAINAAVAANKPLFIQPGTIMIGTPLTISSPVTIIGSGREASILKAANGLNDYVIKFSGGAVGVGIVGAHLADFAVNGNSANQTAGGAILANGSVQCSFERLHTYSVYNWGLLLGPITGGGFGHHNRVISCLFDNSMGSAGFGGGATTTSNDENWFIACDFEFLGGNANPVDNNPVMLYDHAGLQYIVNCNFVSGGHNCIAVRIQNTKGTKVVGCIFDGTAGDGVYIAASRCVVSNNVFTGIGDNGNTVASSVHTQYAAAHNIITQNIFESSAGVNNLRSHIREEQVGNSGPNLIEGNTFTTLTFAPTVAAVESAGNGTVVRNNLGWVTDNRGTATVANGATTAVVTHGLSVTPPISAISVTPTNNLGTAAKFWISNVTATQFTINVDVNPGAATATFSWSIRL